MNHKQTLNNAQKRSLEDEFWILLGQDNIFLDQGWNYFMLGISVVLIFRTLFCKQHKNVTFDWFLGD